MTREALLCPLSLAPGSECNVLVLVDPDDMETAPEALCAHLETDHGMTTWEAITALQEAGETIDRKEST